MATLTEAEDRAEKVRRYEHRLRTDTEFYARTCLSIVDQSQKRVPLVAKPAQHKLESVFRADEEAGRPIRVIILKARKEGMSTWVQAKLTQRYTQRENHKALVVAHDKDTAKEIFEIGELMYGSLPDETVGELRLKPPVVSQQRGYGISLGNPSRVARQSGDVGINSSYLVDTANELQGGRGFTYHSIHASELAFYGDVTTKMISLLNAVPDDPGTMVVIESTANGMNEFHKLWQRAELGRSDYTPVFFAWFDEPDYIGRFAGELEREEFIESIGTGEWGEEEPGLIELLEDRGFGWEEIPERLYWRRWCIENRCLSDLSKFHQEYPSTPEQAFLASGRLVFASALISKAIIAAEEEPRPQTGILEATGEPKRVSRFGLEVQVPNTDPADDGGILWTPREEVDGRRGRAWWDVWEFPDPGLSEEQAWRLSDADGGPPSARPRGQYVIAVDSASGEEDEAGELDSHAIEVINHRTRMQCAEHVSKLDPDLIAMQAYIAGRWFNDAWIAVELTGGWGIAIGRTLWKSFHYPRIYFRKPLERATEKQDDRLGWSTTPATKPLLESHMKQLLREGAHGIRSVELAREMLTYVRDEKGRTGAEVGHHDDRLMAFQIAQSVAQEKPLIPERRGSVVTSTRRGIGAR